MKMNPGGNMPAINQGNIQFVNNPSPQLQSSIQNSPTQHSPMSAQGNKNNNNPGGDSTVCNNNEIIYSSVVGWKKIKI